MILFVGHGSRVAEGNEELLRFTEKLSHFMDVPTETCFLELAPPGIPEGIDRCVKQGAARITVIPLMLFAAGHAKVHIPLAIREAQTKYPHVRFRYGRPVEVDETVLDILAERVRGIKADDETAVLIVGRGSSDRCANSDLYKLARMFWERTRLKWVEVSFVGVTDPPLDSGIERCVRLGARKIVVLPYFLFTGILIRRISEKVNQFQEQHPDLKVQLCPYLGADDSLLPIIRNRVQEVEQGAGVSWEKLAEKALAAGYHHHDHSHSHHHHD
ncbi:MAG: sirohydrochlorin chelatase [Thermoactinomyces sp.]